MLGDTGFLAQLGTAAWVARSFDNAIVDPDLPFIAALEWTLARSEAVRAGREPPPRPAGVAGVRGTVDASALKRDLTALLDAHPILRCFPRSVPDSAIKEACRAIARFRVDCDLADQRGTARSRRHCGWAASAC